jgi:hypothetical protein
VKYALLSFGISRGRRGKLCCPSEFHPSTILRATGRAGQAPVKYAPVKQERQIGFTPMKWPSDFIGQAGPAFH